MDASPPVHDVAACPAATARGAAPPIRAVSDAPALLDRMMADAAGQPAYWVPTGYWQPYAERMRAELDRNGLKDFRRNRNVLKGFALGGAPTPNLPAAKWKRIVWRAVARLPVVSLMQAENERLVQSEHEAFVSQLILLAKLVLAEIARDFPHLAIPPGLANGSPLSAFEWNGQHVTADWVMYLARAAEFYRVVPAESIGALLEIGPGLGLYGLAHVALNPHLRTVINVDIPPVAYVTTQYLKSIQGMEVVDYLDTADLSRIEPEPGTKGPRFYQLLPWQLPALHAEVDLFANMASFQEMDRETCANYVRHVAPMTRRYALLQNARADVAELAAGDHPDLEYIIAQFAPRFGDPRYLASGWVAFLDGEKSNTVLLSTEG